jgi:hypothetical protein
VREGCPPAGADDHDLMIATTATAAISCNERCAVLDVDQADKGPAVTGTSRTSSRSRCPALREAHHFALGVEVSPKLTSADATEGSPGS